MSNTEVPDPKTYYAGLLKQHGATPAAVDASTEGLDIRHRTLRSKFGKLYGKSVLEVGCGYGALRRWFPDTAYTGVDICPEMISAAIGLDLVERSIYQYAQPAFEVRDILTNPFPHTFDFVVASGLFQFNHGLELVDHLVKAMWDHTAHVLAFNMLSRKTAPQQWVNTELHAWPERVLADCFELTPYVEVDHGYMPHDFTVVMRREPRPA